MKYILPLMLVVSAAWAAREQTPKPWIDSESPPVPPASRLETPSWMAAFRAAEEVDPDPAADPARLNVEARATSNPHAILHPTDNPHAGSYAANASLAGQCPRDVHDVDGTHASVEDDPHSFVRVSSPDVPLPTAPLSRSGAANGHHIAELFAKRALLGEQLVRVHAIVVKKTEGILGKTYLHLRDGTGSPGQGDDDLTVTTTESFEPGEAVELEGRVRIDQDLGLGYRYAVLLDEATRVQLN